VHQLDARWRFSTRQRTGAAVTLAGLLAFGGLGIGGSGRADPAIPSPSARELFQEVVEIVRRDFYKPQGLADFDSVVRRLTEPADIARSLSQLQVSQAIDEGLRALKVSHTARYTPDQIDYYELLDIYGSSGGLEGMQALFPPEGTVRYAGIGLVPRWLEGRAFAAYVYDGSPAARAGLLVGDEIVSVDGAPLEAIGSFADKVGKEAAIEIRRQEGAAVQRIAVPVVAVQPAEMLKAAMGASVRVRPIGERHIGYLRIWAYSFEGVSDLLTELISVPPLSEADALVLDLRGRWGGAPPDAAEMFIGRAVEMAYIAVDGTQTTLNARWRKPLVALIDGGTRSGMEVLAYSLQKAGIFLVGERTAGAVIGGRAYLLKDRSLMSLAVVDATVDGKRIEGVGVTPDAAVSFDLRYAAGKDPQLERAFAEAAQRSS
jgi:carboxyl-terminal processing protease